jgi:hypothetical protein
VTDPAKLKALHARRAAELETRGRLHLPPEDLFDKLRDHHRSWTAHQLERGLLRRDKGGEALRPTVRTALRGIRNFLNPFADNFTWLRFLLALFFGLGVPCLGLVSFAGPLAATVERLSLDAGLPPVFLESLALALLLSVTGAVVGGLFAAKSFVWTFALAYLPLRLLGPAGLLPLLLSLWTGFVADRVAWLRDRRSVPV